MTRRRTRRLLMLCAVVVATIITGQATIGDLNAWWANDLVGALVGFLVFQAVHIAYSAGVRDERARHLPDPTREMLGHWQEQKALSDRQAAENRFYRETRADEGESL